MGVTPPRVGVVHCAAGRTELAAFSRADGRGPARWQTRVGLAWEESQLHVHFRCSDDDAWGTFTERDAPLWQQEAVELFVAPGEAVPTRYFEFEVSPSGVLFDARVANPHGDRIGLAVDTAWNCPGIEWGAEPTGERADWRAHLAIPWHGLGLEEAPATLRANFYRIERPRGGEPEFSCWSPTFTSPADFHRPGRFGLLDLIR
jgi:hypothetical protein